MFQRAELSGARTGPRRTVAIVWSLPLCALLLSYFLFLSPVALSPNDLASGNGGGTRPEVVSPARSEQQRRVQYGVASFYADYFDGRRTANGRRFDNDSMVAAHPTHPLGTVVRVTNLKNHRSVNLQIVDRGPASRLRRRGVIIDVSRAAAESLGFVRAGRTRVRVDVVQSATADPNVRELEPR